MGGAIARELIWKFNRWKAQRRQLPPEVRNAGFWTDRKLLIVTTAIIAFPFLLIGAGYILAQALIAPYATH